MEPTHHSNAVTVDVIDELTITSSEVVQRFTMFDDLLHRDESESRGSGKGDKPPRLFPVALCRLH